MYQCVRYDFESLKSEIGLKFQTGLVYINDSFSEKMIAIIKFILD